MAQLELQHAVPTVVIRDDLADGGAMHIVAAIRTIRQGSPSCRIELLISDLQGNGKALEGLRSTGTALLTSGQYLPPAELASLVRRARSLGFNGVQAGPLVRSSYHAAEQYEEVIHV